jgi:hypothetical protein
MKRVGKKKASPFRFLRSHLFWIPFAVTLIIAGLFFAWELGVFIGTLPTIAPRPSILPSEFAFTAGLSFLLALNVGLVVWQSRFGSCPRGVKRASSIATAIGALSLICPVCVLLPASLVSVGFIFGVLMPFMPALRLLSIGLLCVTAVMLWPKAK